MDNINLYLDSAYNECVFDEVSTCRFFFTSDGYFDIATGQCLDFFNSKSNFVIIQVSNNTTTPIKDWYDYIKYSLQNMIYDNGSGICIKGFADIVEYFNNKNKSSLNSDQSFQNLESNEFYFNSLRNAVLHFINPKNQASEVYQSLRNYINGECIKISNLRLHGINDVKVNINRRNCLIFFKTCIEILIKLGAENIAFLNFGSDFSNKGELFISSKIIKDFIDLTALNYLQKSLVVFVINGSFDMFANQNEALKTRLDSCIRILGKPFPTISPMVEIGKE